MAEPYTEKITVRFRKLRIKPSGHLGYIIIEQGDDEVVLTTEQAVSLIGELSKHVPKKHIADRGNGGASEG